MVKVTFACYTGQSWEICVKDHTTQYLSSTSEQVELQAHAPKSKSMWLVFVSYIKSDTTNGEQWHLHKRNGV